MVHPGFDWINSGHHFWLLGSSQGVIKKKKKLNKTIQLRIMVVLEIVTKCNQWDLCTSVVFITLISVFHAESLYNTLQL